MCSRRLDPKCRLKSSQVKSMYFNHPSRGNSTNYSVMMGPRDKTAPPTSQQIKKIHPKRVKYLVTLASIFLIYISSSSTGELFSQPIRGNVCQTGRMFPEHVERSFLDPKYSFVAVWWILRTIFVKQKFTLLRTNYICRILSTMFVNKCSPN